MHTLRFYFLLYQRPPFSQDDFYAAQNAARKPFFRCESISAIGNKTSIVAEIFRVLAEDGFQRKARIEVLCSQPFAVIKRRLVLVP